MNKILAAWEWNGPVSEPTAYGEGHINQALYPAKNQY